MIDHHSLHKRYLYNFRPYQVFGLLAISPIYSATTKLPPRNSNDLFGDFNTRFDRFRLAIINWK